MHIFFLKVKKETEDNAYIGRKGSGEYGRDGYFSHGNPSV